MSEVRKYNGRVELQVTCQECSQWGTVVSFFNNFVEPKIWAHECGSNPEKPQYEHRYTAEPLFKRSSEYAGHIFNEFAQPRYYGKVPYEVKVPYATTEIFGEASGFSAERFTEILKKMRELRK